MKIKSISVLLIAFVVTGCASYTYTDAPPTLGVMYSKYAYIGYDGDLKKIEDVGVVTTDGLIQIREIDGKTIAKQRVYKTSGLYSGGRVQLHLLPGAHTLILGFNDDRGTGIKSWSISNVAKTITIDKGQVIHLWLYRNGGAWTARESDGKAALSTITSDFNELTHAK